VRRLNRRYTTAALLMVLIGPLACADNITSPRKSADAFAQYTDRLYLQTLRFPFTTGVSYRLRTLTYAEMAAAFGASPAYVTVNTPSGPEKWGALAFTEVNPQNMDSVAVLVAWRDIGFNTALFAETSAPDVLLLDQDTVWTGSTTPSTLTIVAAPSDSACAALPGLQNTNVYFTYPNAESCQPATFRIALDVSFPSYRTAPPSPPSLALSASTIPGERFTQTQPF
jgi:hypothetical protein